MKYIQSFIFAWEFLTAIPIPSWLKKPPKESEAETREVPRIPSSYFFPAVGLCIGGMAALLSWFYFQVFPQTVASICLILSLWIIPGGLHLDGLADTADGFFSSRPREDVLEIMRDSRSGPMAIAVLIGVFGLKWASLMEIPTNHRMSFILLAPLLSRLNLLLTLSYFPYARKEGGLASLFLIPRSPWVFLINSVFTGAIAILLLQGRGLVLMGVSFIFASLLMNYSNKKIGGFTGDTLGALNELSELIVFLFGCTLGGKGSLS